MKSISAIVLILVMCFAGIAQGQVATIKAEDIQKLSPQDITDILRKGTYRYNINQGITIRGGGVKHDGDKIGSRTIYNVDVGTDYFVADNILVGGRLNLSGDKEKYDEPSTTDKYSDWMIYASGGYGFDIDGKVILIPKLTLGYGQEKNKYEDSGGESKHSYNKFRAILQVDAPFNIYKNYVFVTPSIGYLYGSCSDEDWKDTEHNFFAMANFELFMGCEQHVCDCERDWQIPEDRYGAGLLELGGRANTAIQFGGYTSTWTDNHGDENKTKYGYNNIDFQGSAAYYPLDNFGAGLGFVLNSGMQKEKDSDWKYNSNSYMIRPFVKYHVPVSGVLNNLYGEIGYGFGNQKTRYRHDDIDETDKTGLSQWDVNVGYDYWVNDIMSLGAVLSYANLTSNNKGEEHDYKSKWGGMGFGITWNVYIPTR